VPRLLIVHPTLHRIAEQAMATLPAGTVERLLVIGGSWRKLDGSGPADARRPVAAGCRDLCVHTRVQLGNDRPAQGHPDLASLARADLPRHGDGVWLRRPGRPVSGAGADGARRGLRLRDGHTVFRRLREIATRFEPARVLERLADGRFTGVFMVPMHFQSILSLPPTLTSHRRTAQSLKTIISNAAALPQPLKERIIEYFGEGLLHETYGSTEAGIVANIRPEDQLRTNRSVGRAFALNEIRLLGADGAEVAVGEVGELYSRSPYLFDGYWGHPSGSRIAPVPAAG
jgi:hypothetical protein